MIGNSSNWKIPSFRHIQPYQWYDITQSSLLIIHNIGTLKLTSPISILFRECNVGTGVEVIEWEFFFKFRSKAIYCMLPSRIRLNLNKHCWFENHRWKKIQTFSFIKIKHYNQWIFPLVKSLFIYFIIIGREAIFMTIFRW